MCDIDKSMTHSKSNSVECMHETNEGADKCVIRNSFSIDNSLVYSTNYINNYININKCKQLRPRFNDKDCNKLITIESSV